MASHHIFEYDVKCKRNTWVQEVRKVSECLHLPSPHDRVEYDLDAANAAIKMFSRNVWWREAEQKPKLRSYGDFK